VIERMVQIVRLLKTSIASGIAGTEYADRVLPAQAPGFAAALAAGRLVGDPVLNRIVLATTALMEVKSSMGVIVAAPTAARVAKQMPRELRCTALGGLSITPASLAIEARLAARKAAACGAGTCGCG
jgi:L-serine dehydratase